MSCSSSTLNSHFDTRFDFTVQNTVMHMTAFTTHDVQAPRRKSLDSHQSDISYLQYF